jgi:hypothetical protein
MVDIEPLEARVFLTDCTTLLTPGKFRTLAFLHAQNLDNKLWSLQLVQRLI